MIVLVSMTRIKETKPVKPRKSPKAVRIAGRQPSGAWLLQDAKARFSELVRRVRSEGPQHVTVHGRDEVVVISAEEFRRLKGDLTGAALIEAMQASPCRDIDIEPQRDRLPVRCRPMTGWLLDTNFLSELRRSRPAPKVVAFIREKPLDLLWTGYAMLSRRRSIAVLTGACLRVASN
jgi:prevent-host-death family protein